LNKDIEKQLISSLPPDVQAKVKGSPNVIDSIEQFIQEGEPDQLNILGGKFLDSFERLMAHRIELERDIENQKEAMSQLRVRSLAEVSVFRSQILTIVTQKYGLHEFPAPRLFVALPEDTSRWNYKDPFANKLRLHFLCECGEHTMASDGTYPHIHLARHEGYDIAHTEEFLQRYGPYVLTVLRMLKFRISVAGIDVPSASALICPNTRDDFTASLLPLVDNIESGIDQVMGCIEKTLGGKDKGKGAVESPEQMGCNTPLNGEDLYQMGTFLKSTKRSNALGNLYRTINQQKHVKWVCSDHYRDNYLYRRQDASPRLEDSLDASFSENTGRLEKELQTVEEANDFYLTLQQATQVYELKVTFYWNTSEKEIKQLQDTLSKTNIGVLDLILWEGKRYRTIFDIMQQSSIQSFAITGPLQGFFDRFDPSSYNDAFKNLRFLEISKWIEDKDIPVLERLLGMTTNLTQLKLWVSPALLPQTYSAISKYQTYPIMFGDLSLRLLPPPSQQTTAIRELGHLLRSHGGQIEAFKLNKDELDDKVIEAFAEATKSGSRLKEFTLEKVYRKLSDKCIKDLADIVSRSQLHKLQIDLENLQDGEERARILEQVEWKYLRQLWITLGNSSQWMKVLKALMKSETADSVLLEHLMLECDGTLSNNEGALLGSFLSSRALKHLELYWDMPLNQVLNLLEGIDFSQMRSFSLSAGHFSEEEVQTILNSIQPGTELQIMCLRGAKITDEQRAQMTKSGITLHNLY